MRRLKNLVFAVFLLGLFSPLSLFADEVTLMSGKKVEGKVLDQSDDYVIVDVNGVNMVYRRFEIKDIVIGKKEAKQKYNGDIPVMPDLPAGVVPEAGPPPSQATKIENIDDPLTRDALKKFNVIMGNIGKDCEPPAKNADYKEVLAKASQCICSHLPETVKANEIKVSAFMDLMQRRPELVRKTVRINGVAGIWFLDPGDADKNTMEEMGKIYNCQ